MALNTDNAYKFGCGRYIQERDAIRQNLAAEVRRAGTKPYIVFGVNGRRVAGEQIYDALRAAGIGYAETVFTGIACDETADELYAAAVAEGCDLIIGVGGGVLMDAGKYAAVKHGLPIIQLPTSAATCAATSALAVLYEKDTRKFVGSMILFKEADAVIVDLDVMIRQPARLLCAGIMDSSAKMIEIPHRMVGREEDEITLGLPIAFDLAKAIYAEFEKHTAGVLEDMEKGEITPRFERAIFYTLAVTGMISGASKNKNQSALAHQFYYHCRRKFVNETAGFIHGELVSAGLIPQMIFNGIDPEPVVRRLKAMGLPTCFTDVNIPATEENLEYFVNAYCTSGALDEDTPAIRARVREALTAIWH